MWEIHNKFSIKQWLAERKLPSLNILRHTRVAMDLRLYPGLLRRNFSENIINLGENINLFGQQRKFSRTFNLNNFVE